MTSERPNIFMVFFFAVFLFLLVVSFYIFKPFFNAFAWAIILSLVLYPLYKRLSGALKGNKTISALSLEACAGIS